MDCAVEEGKEGKEGEEEGGEGSGEVATYSLLH